MISYPFTSKVTYDEQGLPLYDRAVDSAFLRQIYKQYFSDGVHYNPTNALQVVADTGMNVKVLPGTCHIQGAMGIEEAEEVLQIEPAEPLDRIDTIVVRLDLSIEKRSIYVCVVKGESAESPMRKELVRNNTVWELGLADILVSKNVSAITQENITDTRLDNSRCGIMGPNIEKLDTTAYYEQIIAKSKELQKVIDGIVAGSQSMLKTTYDKDNNGIVDNAEKLGGQLPSYYATKSAVDAAMPKSGGSFTGAVYANSGKSSSSCLRNIQITDSADTPQSTGYIKMVRK